jgi:hypothetical protein
MASNLPAFFQLRCERFTQKCNVFVIPGISVGNRRAIRDRRDLITICGALNKQVWEV